MTNQEPPGFDELASDPSASDTSASDTPTSDAGTEEELLKSPQPEIEGLETFGEDTPPEPPPPPAPMRVVPPSAPPDAAAPVEAPAPVAPAPASRPRRKRRRPVSIFFPLLLIMVGGLLLLQNLGYVPSFAWSSLWRLWPLLLIAMGIDTLFGRRSTFGAILSALLILALLGGALFVVLNASQFPWMDQWVQDGEWRSEEIAHPLSGVDQARIRVDWASVPLQLYALEDSTQLIEGTVVYRGRLQFETVSGRRTAIRLSTDPMGMGWPPLTGVGSGDVVGFDRRWSLGLSPRVPLALELDGGSGSADLDLRDLALDELTLDVASGAVDLYLPSGEYEVWIDGGSGSLDLWLPEGAGVQVVVDDGSGALRMDERFLLVEGKKDGDSVWESDNFDRAEQVIRVDLDVGSGRVRVQDGE